MKNGAPCGTWSELVKMKAHKTKFIITNHNGAHVNEEYDFGDHYRVYNETPKIKNLYMTFGAFAGNIFKTGINTYDEIPTIDNYPRLKSYEST